MNPITREQRRQLARDNAKQPLVMTLVPVQLWPANRPSNVIESWRSRDFVAAVYQEADGVERISINRTEMNGADRWQDGITWDDMQRIKREIGRGNCYTIEIFPCDKDVVNVANMRHLWVLREPLNVGWFKS